MADHAISVTPASHSHSRRALLRGQLHAEAPLRPPWALPEAAFTDVCTACHACLTACPESVLVRGPGGYPVFSPQRGECTFCGDCETACKPRALDRGGNRDPWNLLPQFGENCLTAKGVVCRSCSDACGDDAIVFPRARVPSPQVNADCCTGCGACVAACPTHAINLHHLEALAP
ncbi:ferredoxin-type protein NapF [Luteimonas sp. A478]